jgi:hypothetical protein
MPNRSTPLPPYGSTVFKLKTDSIPKIVQRPGRCFICGDGKTWAACGGTKRCSFPIGNTGIGSAAVLDIGPKPCKLTSAHLRATAASLPSNDEIFPGKRLTFRCRARRVFHFGPSPPSISAKCATPASVSSQSNVRFRAIPTTRPVDQR